MKKKKQNKEMQEGTTRRERIGLQGGRVEDEIKVDIFYDREERPREKDEYK